MPGEIIPADYFPAAFKELRLGEGAAGEVAGEEKLALFFRIKLLKEGAGPVEVVKVEALYPPLALKQGDEAVRAEQALFRVLPAGESFCITF